MVANFDIDTKKKELLKALEKSLGVVTSACKAVNLSRAQYYEWLKEDTEFAKAVKDIGEIGKDFGESALHKKIEGGDVTAIIFFLKKKAVDRGYGDTWDNQEPEKIEVVVKVVKDV